MNTLVKLLADTDYDVQQVIGEEVAKFHKTKANYQEVLDEFSKLLPDCELVSFPEYLKEPDHEIFINGTGWGGGDLSLYLYISEFGVTEGDKLYRKHVNTHYKCICEIRDEWCLAADTESDDY